MAIEYLAAGRKHGLLRREKHRMQNILNMKYTRDETQSKRREIAALVMLHSQNIKTGTVSAMSTDDISLLFRLYDRIFFGGWFSENYRGKLKFSLSRRMTKSAGLTICPKNAGRIKPEDLEIEIRIGVDFFFQYGLIEGSKTVCGIETENSLEALQLVFEHELCHVIEFIHYKRSNCKGKRFKALANNLFGHTESWHKLPTNKQIANQRLGLKIGDTVEFEYKGRSLKGFISNINKRATVMVRDSRGPLIDRKGNRYSRYYVPLTRLCAKK